MRFQPGDKVYYKCGISSGWVTIVNTDVDNGQGDLVYQVKEKVGDIEFLKIIGQNSYDKIDPYLLADDWTYGSRFEYLVKRALGLVDE